MESQISPLFVHGAPTGRLYGAFMSEIRMYVLIDPMESRSKFGCLFVIFPKSRKLTHFLRHDREDRCIGAPNESLPIY